MNGKYQISNLGRIKSLYIINNKTKSIIHREKILRQSIRTNYYGITLSKNGTHKNFSIHRLVAIHFIPNPDNLPEVNHKDENKLNNKADNLEWCDKKYNLNYGKGAEKSKAQARLNIINNSKPIRCIETGIIYPSAAAAEKLTGIHACDISSARTGRYKTAGGYHWEYV